jgi:ribosomal protein S18 acetylase RimI-like enzyme
MTEPAHAIPPAMTPYGTLMLRPEGADHAAFLFDLHETVKGAELAQMPVPEPIRRQLLDMQFRAMSMSYRAGYPAARFAIITLNDTPIGRLITNDGGERFHILHIALLPEWRSRGIGKVLMTTVLDEPKRRGKTCEATVAADNFASLRLWARLGFIERERDDINVILEWRPS